MDEKKEKRVYEDTEFTIDGDTVGKVKRGKKSKNNKKPSKLKQKWSALKKWKKAVIIAVAVILLLAVVAVCVVWGIYDGFRTDIDENNLGISNEIENKYGETDIFNIAIFGVDSRNENAFSGRSDSIIIVSVDRANNSVKLTSILRDSYVPIEGYKNQKIAHAYAFGGAELAIKTVNQNFNMNITDYATINFFRLADAIDVMGGIDIEITESEMNQINSEAIGGDYANYRKVELLKDYGSVHLNGDQASIYARLRHYDSDEVRSQRQKNVINALIVQAKKVSPTKYSEVVKTLMSLCETSLSFSEVMSFAPMITKEIKVEAITVPGEPESAIGGTYEGAWVWRYDLSSAADRIHMFIYGEVPETTTSSKPQKTTKASDKNSDGTKKDNNNSGDKKPVTTEPNSEPTSGTTAVTETTTAKPETTATTKPDVTGEPESGTTEPTAA